MAEKSINDIEIELMLQSVKDCGDIMMDSRESHMEIQDQAASIFGEDPSENQKKAVMLFGDDAALLIGKL